MRGLGRLGGLTIAAGLALATVVGSTPSAMAGVSAHRPLCVELSCRTLEQDPQAVIFRAARRNREGRLLFSGTYSRWRASGRVSELGDQYHGGESLYTLMRPVLAGPFVGYALVGYGRYNGEGASWRIMRADARTGRREEARGSRVGGERGGTITTPCDGGLEEGSPGVTDLHVYPGGVMAWIIGALPPQRYAPKPTKVSTYSVCGLAPGSRLPVLLASTRTVAPRSLAVVRRTVHWSEAGSPRSAEL